MSDPTPQKLNSDTLDEELVSYLDGELESQAAQRLENMLASDETARQRLNQLAVSWDLLDQLPRATVGDLFTRTTVEMAAVATEDEIAQTTAAAPARQRRRWFAGGVAALLAAAVGFVAFGLVMPDQNDPLLRNLPVVVNLDLYRSVGDVELLKTLEASNSFATDVAVAPPRSSSANAPVEKSVTPPPASFPKSMSSRRVWVAGLSPEKKLELNANFEKFVALSPDEKQSVRAIDDYLQANSEQAENLTHTMQRYHDWLKTLSPAERADLSDSTTPQQQLAEINKIKQKQQGRLFALLGVRRGATPTDVGYVSRWMQDFAGKHEKEIIDALPDEVQQELKNQARWGGDHDDQRRRQARLAWELFRPNSPVKMPDISDADLQPLVAQLSAEKQSELKAVSDMDARVGLLRQWILAAIAEIAQQRSRFASQGDWRGGGAPNAERRAHFLDEQLKRFEDSLPAEEQERLSKLPEDQKRAQLQSMYQKQHPGGRSGRGFQRPRGDGPRGAPGGKDEAGPLDNRPDEEMDQPPPPPAP